MSEKIKESISALIDEEISELEVHRLLRQFGGQQELKTSWIRYLQIRATCQGDRPLTTQQHLDLHSRISQAIAKEAVYDGSSATKAWLSRASVDKWYKPLAGFAVAASLVMTVSVYFYKDLQSNPMDGVTTEITASHTVSPQATQTVSAPLQTTSAITLVPHGALEAGRGTDTAAVHMPEALRELSPQAQEKFRQYLRRHELMNRRNFNHNLSTVKFDPSKSQVPQQGSN